MLIKNTLTGKKEPLDAQPWQEIKIYVCGITPYDHSHLGHARTVVSFDNIRRYLLYRGYKVKYVQNITDIDDKIINRAREMGVPPLQLSAKYARLFEEECRKLGVMEPDLSPKVSECIPQIISLIARLEEKGAAYRTPNGIYFDVSKFPGYGKLSRQDQGSLLSGARVEVDESKRNPQDFALWKFGSEEGASFPSPWGAGRPGWHIECSAMALHALGDTIDIHGGGRDLVFPHHENEIAQSETATGRPFVRFWVHTGFFTVNGEKMSKSLGNFITLSEGLEKYGAKSLRMLFTMAHYSSPIDFSEEAILSARRSLDSLYQALSYAKSYSCSGDCRETGIAEFSKAAESRFISAMDDDFDTPSAMAEVFSLAKRISKECSEGFAEPEGIRAASGVLRRLLGVFALLPSESQEKEAGAINPIAAACRKFGLPAPHSAEEGIQSLLSLRESFRKMRDFKQADAIRLALLEAGVLVEDRKGGSSSWRFATPAEEGKRPA